MTDEVFAVYTMEDEKNKGSGMIFFFIIFGAWLSWNLGTLIGYGLSGYLSASLMASFGMALYAMFIAFLMPALCKLQKLWIPVGVSALIGMLISSFVSSNAGLIIGSLAGAFVGTFVLSEEDLS